MGSMGTAGRGDPGLLATQQRTARWPEARSQGSEAQPPACIDPATGRGEPPLVTARIASTGAAGCTTDAPPVDDRWDGVTPHWLQQAGRCLLSDTRPPHPTKCPGDILGHGQRLESND